MAERATFFFSHTSADRNMPGGYLDKFFDDLEAHVAEFEGVLDPQRESLGTIDREIRLGADWDRHLSGALRRARAFVALMTPAFFGSPNCGKELYGFLLRCERIGIDTRGALTDVENVLAIRWLPPEYYQLNAEPDARIPPILRRIQSVPADAGRDADRTKAIEGYRKKGMRRYVGDEPIYTELLRLFVLAIEGMNDLPEGPSISFDTLENAFAYSWKQHFAARNELPAMPPPEPPAPVVTPEPLHSLVAFYVTRQSFKPASTKVDFADMLIDETPSLDAPPEASRLLNLIAHIRAAGTIEGFRIFHAASDPAAPPIAGPLLQRLAALSNRGVPTALIVDAALWPSAAKDPAAAAIGEIIVSNEWTGSVLVAPIAANAAVSGDVLAAASRNALRPVVALPPVSDHWIPAFQRALIDIRGRLFQAGLGRVPEAEHLPLLQGVGAVTASR